MKKLLATLIAGFLVSSAFAQAPKPPAPVAPSATTTGPATAPMGDGTAANKAKTMPKHMKHGKKHADKAMAK